MRVLIWFGSLLFAFVGMSLLLAGSFIAFTTDWQPTRELRPDEVDRIRVASIFIEARRKETGDLPTAGEFQLWADAAPKELRLDGVGFKYSTNLPRTYRFDWWGGDVWLRWRSDSSKSELAEISSADYFIFGSKVLDLIIFIGLGIGALVAVRKISPA